MQNSARQTVLLSAWALVVSFAQAQGGAAPVSPANSISNGGYFPFSLSAKGANLQPADLIYQVDDGTAEFSIGLSDGSKNAEVLFFRQ